MPELTIVHEIRFSAEAMVLMERLAASLAALLHPPTPPRLAVQTEAPGVSAPAPICEASPPPAEGPSRAAGGTGGGRSQPTPAAPFDVWLTAKRKAILIEHWPTNTPVETIVAMMEAASPGPMPAKPAKQVGQRAFLMGLKRPEGYHPRKAAAEWVADAPPLNGQAVPDPKPMRILSPEHLEKVRENAAKGAAAALAKRASANPEPEPVQLEPIPVVIDKPMAERPAASPVPAAVRAPPPEPASRLDIMRRIAAIKPATVDPGKPKGEPILASQETIRDWAITRGLDMGRDFDIDAVNQKAASIGHPGFILRSRVA